MNEPLLIPQYAQSLHINTPETLVSLQEICQQIGVAFKSVFDGVASAIAKVFQPLADMMKQWGQRLYQRPQPRPRRPSAQTRAFLRIVNVSKRGNEIHVKRRRRSARKTYAEAILKEKPVAFYRLGEVK